MPAIVEAANDFVVSKFKACHVVVKVEIFFSRGAQGLYLRGHDDAANVPVLEVTSNLQKYQ